MDIIIFIILVSLFMFLYLMNKGNMLNPSVFQLIPWIISLGGYIVAKDIFINISLNTIIWIFLGIIFFQIGFIGSKIFKINCSKKKSDLQINFKYILNDKAISFLVILNLIALILMIIKAVKISDMVNQGNFYTSLRIGLGVLDYVTGGYGVLVYFRTLSYVTTNFLLGIYFSKRYESKKIKVNLIISSITSIIMAILATGRGYLLTLILIFVTYLYLNSKNYKKANIFLCISGISFFIIFILYTLVLRSWELRGSNLNDILKYIVNEISLYTSGSLPALDHLINSSYNLSYGENMFRTLNLLLNRLGYDFNIIDLVRVSSPGEYGSNLYTVYDPYIRDFGVSIIPIFQLACGFLNGYIYYKSLSDKKNSVIYMFLYAFLISALANQSLGDKYFSLATSWIQYIVLAIVFYKTKIFMKIKS